MSSSGPDGRLNRRAFVLASASIVLTCSQLVPQALASDAIRLVSLLYFSRTILSFSGACNRTSSARPGIRSS